MLLSWHQTEPEGPAPCLSCHVSFLCTSELKQKYLNINKVVSAKRTSALVAALEPAEQTDRVEGVLASGTPLVRCLHVC